MTTQTQIHGFSNASKVAYGSVIYLRTPKCKACPEGDVSLIMAKGRIVPLASPLRKDNSIPKLELTGVVLVACLMVSCIKGLGLNKNIPKFLWSDATTALQWLRKNYLKDVFVSNRVKEVM